MDPALTRRAVALVGPTASGKSALALQLAPRLGAEIVSCDSLQVYRGFDIGSAKPTADERARVRHHLVDVAEPGDPTFSAARYAELAWPVLEDLAARGRLPLVVGGTGLYLKALMAGLFEGPARDEHLRRRLEAWAERFGDARLHRLLAHVDPQTAARVQPADRVRVVRALEVYHSSGQPLSAHIARQPAAREGWTWLTVGLLPTREVLRGRVEARSDAMLAAGLLDEVRGLLASGLAPTTRALQSIGYRQACAVLAGTTTLAEARRDMVSATMRYAKRQVTWFRHQAQVHWCPSPEQAATVVLAWLDSGGERA